MFATWIPIVISIFALWISYRSHEEIKKTSKNSFLNMLRDKIKSAKHIILKTKRKKYSINEKNIFIETIQDLLLYQGYKNEKQRYLLKETSDSLFNLQEQIEDYLSFILNNIDAEHNRELAKDALNNFLDIL